jgi:hypothetical protein
MGRERRCPMTERPGFLAILQRIASNGVRRLIRGQAREVRSGIAERGCAPAIFDSEHSRFVVARGNGVGNRPAMSHGLEAGKRPFHRSTRAANSHPRCR